MRDAEGRPVRAVTLPDGGEFALGRVRLLLVLAETPEPPLRHPREDEEAGYAADEADAFMPRDGAGDEWFDVNDDYE